MMIRPKMLLRSRYSAVQLEAMMYYFSLVDVAEKQLEELKHEDELDEQLDGQLVAFAALM